MARLLDLDVAVKRSGLPIVAVPGWRTRGSSSYSPVGDIVIHHTATSAKATGDYPSLRIVRDGRSDLPGPLAQLGLGRAGNVYLIASGRANHAGRTDTAAAGNARSIGIEAEHPGTGPWPAAQYAAYVRLVAALCIHYRKTVSAVRGHKEVAVPKGRKNDPNFSMSQFRADVQAQINRGLGAASTPDASQEITPILKKGSKGYRVNELQGLLNYHGLPTEIDGDFGQATAGQVGEFQRRNGLDADQIVGNATWNKLRNTVRVAVAPRVIGTKRTDGNVVVSGGNYFAPGTMMGDGPLRFVLQEDLNAVLYHGGSPLWASTVRMDQLSLQTDDHLVGYLKGKPVWTAGAVGKGLHEELVLRTDRNLVWYIDGKPVWSTGTYAR